MIGTLLDCFFKSFNSFVAFLMTCTMYQQNSALQQDKDGLSKEA